MLSPPNFVKTLNREVRKEKTKDAKRAFNKDRTYAVGRRKHAANQKNE
jgi:hypothetical protein